MWIYQKKLQFPVMIKDPDLNIAKALMAQYGGPDSELGAGVRYLTQRFAAPDDRVRATLNDIGTEEIAHWEMIGAMIHQTMHGRGVYPADPNGVPFTASYIQSTGDPITDIWEDMAAEQKARTTYEHIMNQTDCEQYLAPLRFLREREVVHFQRFAECYNILKELYPEGRQNKLRR